MYHLIVFLLIFACAAYTVVFLIAISQSGWGIFGAVIILTIAFYIL